MSFVTYTAKRRLKSGHSADTAYSIDFGSEQLSPNLVPVRQENRSIGGATETIGQRYDETWAVTTTFIDESAFADWMEFFGSVAFGEAFTFDAYGTSSSPDNAQSAILVGDPSLQRVSNQQYYKASFNVRVVL